MPIDPRTQLKAAFQHDPEFIDELNTAVDEARGAEEILNSENVIKLFDGQLWEAFHAFCRLEETAGIKEYRSVHLRARGIIRFRDMLMAKITRKNELLRQKEHDEKQHNGEI